MTAVIKVFGRLTIPVLPIFAVLTVGRDFTPSTVSYLEYDVVCECFVAERFCNALLFNATERMHFFWRVRKISKSVC